MPVVKIRHVFVSLFDRKPLPPVIEYSSVGLTLEEALHINICCFAFEKDNIVAQELIAYCNICARLNTDLYQIDKTFQCQFYVSIFQTLRYQCKIFIT